MTRYKALTYDNLIGSIMNQITDNYPLFIAVAAIIAFASGYFVLTGSSNNENATIVASAPTVPVSDNQVFGVDFPPMPQPTQVAARYLTNIQPAAGENEAVQDETEKKTEELDEFHSSDIRVENALRTRAIGNPKAPIKIEEFFSITCSHCATFHEKTFPVLKEKYIDTGQVYFVFGDFPLDKVALDATVTARCLDESRYEAFVSLLLKTQRQWVTEGYEKALRQNAKLAGLSDEQFNFCMENEEIREGIAENRKYASDKYDVRSTPTFIFNYGEEKLSGAASIKAFDQVIGKLSQ